MKVLFHIIETGLEVIVYNHKFVGNLSFSLNYMLNSPFYVLTLDTKLQWEKYYILMQIYSFGWFAVLIVI